MDSISGTTANINSTDPLNPEMHGVAHLDTQLNEGLDDAVSKDCREIRSLDDYNVQTVSPENSVDESRVSLAKELETHLTVSPENSVDESGISLAKELETLLEQGEVEMANIKLAEAINKNLTLEGLISDNDLYKCFVNCLSHTIAPQCLWFGQPPFQELIENLVKLGIDPKAALHQTFMFYTSVKVSKSYCIGGKYLGQYLNDAESATEVKFRDLIKSHTRQQLWLTLNKDKNLSLIDAKQYLKLLGEIEIEPDKQLLASEIQVWLADAIHQKCTWHISEIIEMDKQWEFGLQIDAILVPEVKADLENCLHVQLKTAMEKKDLYNIIELVRLANTLELNYKNDDLKQPMTDSLLAAVGSSCLSRLLEIAKTLGLDLNEITPELKEQYPPVFCDYLKMHLGGYAVKKELDSWFQRIKLLGMDLHDNREEFDSFIFNELYIDLLGNLKEYKETTLPHCGSLFYSFLYICPCEDILVNAALLEIDFDQPEIKDKIYDICRQMIFEHYHNYEAASNQVH